MGRGGLFIIAGVLLLAGVGLLAVAAATPWHTDSDAYFAGLGAIRERLYDGTPDFSAAGEAFNALQRHHSTPKWLLADGGYAAIAWSAVAALVGFLRPDRRAPLTSQRWKIVVPVVLGGLLLVFVGLLAATFQSIGREQIPEWADSMAVPIMVAVTSLTILTPVYLLFAVTPLFYRQRKPASLFALGVGWIGGFLFSLVYLIPLALAVFLVLALFGGVGGWALSTGGALLTWATLNGRAIALGHRTNTPLP